MEQYIVRAIDQYATEGIQITDAEGNYIFCNQAFTAITGIPVEQRLGRNVRDVQQDGATSTVLRTGQPVHGHVNNASAGCTIVSNAAPIRDERGKIVGAISVFNDRSSFIKLAQDLREQEEELRRLKGQLRKMDRSSYSFRDLLGADSAFRACVELARQAADSDAAVLITGESGTGKELFAHAIHGASRRAEAPLIRVNCPAIPASLMESELFGYEKGAFTDAKKDKPGKFELAQKGSIFLDEIGDMEFTLQGKLLRVLQEHEVERIGGTKTIPLDVRVISATNQNLEEQIRDKRFRQDLYYRLNVIQIRIPPLCQRRGDIPLLMEEMLKKHNDKGVPITLTKEAMALLMEYDWPGNVRELENTAERLLLFRTGSEISKSDVLNVLGERKPGASALPQGATLAQLEAMAIRDALKRHGSDLAGKRAAAAELDISLSGLYKKLKGYGIR